jgi:hypothetical protein
MGYEIWIKFGGRKGGQLSILKHMRSVIKDSKRNVFRSSNSYPEKRRGCHLAINWADVKLPSSGVTTHRSIPEGNEFLKVMRGKKGKIQRDIKERKK